MAWSHAGAGFGATSDTREPFLPERVNHTRWASSMKLFGRRTWGVPLGSTFWHISLLLGSSFAMVKACALPQRATGRCALTPQRSR